MGCLIEYTIRYFCINADCIADVESLDVFDSAYVSAYHMTKMTRKLLEIKNWDPDDTDVYDNYN